MPGSAAPLAPLRCRRRLRLRLLPRLLVKSTWMPTYHDKEDLTQSETHSFQIPMQLLLLPLELRRMSGPRHPRLVWEGEFRLFAKGEFWPGAAFAGMG